MPRINLGLPNRVCKVFSVPIRKSAYHARLENTGLELKRPTHQAAVKSSEVPASLTTVNIKS